MPAVFWQPKLPLTVGYVFDEPKPDFFVAGSRMKMPQMPFSTGKLGNSHGIRLEIFQASSVGKK